MVRGVRVHRRRVIAPDTIRRLQRVLTGARFAGQFQGRTDAVELKLRINSGQVRDTQVWFGSLAGTTEIKVPLPAYLTGKPSESINPQEVKAVLTLAGSPFLSAGAR